MEHMESDSDMLGSLLDAKIEPFGKTIWENLFIISSN